MRLFKNLIKIKGDDNHLISPKGPYNKLYKSSPISITGNNNSVNIHPVNDIQKLDITILGNDNQIDIDQNMHGALRIVISGSHIRVKIGKDCVFRGCEMAAFDHHSVLEFGDGSMAARDSRIYASDFHTIYDLQTLQPINQGTHIRIGKHVWIGEGALILKNHSIADNTIIAAHSVVTKDLPESNAIYAGNPATLKKANVNWDYRVYDDYLKDIQQTN